AELIEIDSKYFETERLSNEDLEKAKNLLKDEQKSVDEIINIFADGNINIAIGPIKNVKNTITRAKELINNNEINQALTLLDRCQIEIDDFLNNLEDEESKKKLSNINEKNENIKLLQEKYADSFSKNQLIKKESIKRNERIKAIESEVESWKNLLSNSQKMVTELTERKNKLLSQLNERDQQPKAQAEKKGQATEGLRISQNEKIENEKIIEETDKKINALSPEIVKSPVVQKPISITSPLPKEGKTPKITAKRYMNKIPITKVGKETPSKETAKIILLTKLFRFIPV
ncbi:hypothetical protein OAR15_01060, partial [Candidatus Pelagibacter sp.]|nr:hypothetical protein [Candidatus Pelagibacter sp.]